jgi:hypothetical protein
VFSAGLKSRPFKAGAFQQPFTGATMPNTTLGADLDKELHDLCQPLTNLSCFLELGQIMGDPDSMKTSVDGALVECRRMFESIANMRVLLAQLRDETAEVKELR